MVVVIGGLRGIGEGKLLVFVSVGWLLLVLFCRLNLMFLKRNVV